MSQTGASSGLAAEASSILQMPAHSPERIFWIDYARAIGITLVVIGHVIRGLRVDEVGPILQYYDKLDDVIYSFHMPLFFFLSGFIFAPRASSPLPNFVRATIVGLVVPYVIWSILFVAVQHLVSRGVNHPYDLEQLAWMWRFPIAHMWFLYALFFAHIAAYATGRLFGRIGWMVLLAAWGSAYLYGAWTELDRIAPGLTMGGAFLLFGIVASLFVRLSKSRLSTALVAVIACIVWIAANVYWQRGLVSELPQVAAISGVVMTVVACLLLSDWRGRWATLVAQLGQASIAIYVAHVIFAAGLRVLFYRYGIFDCTLHVVAGTAVGVLIPAVLFVVANRLQIAPYVGFGRTQKFLYVAPAMKLA